MAGSYYSGRVGVLRFEGQRIARVASWRFNGQVDLMETTSLADDARTYEPGIQSGSGSAAIWMHRDNAAAATAAGPLLDKVLRNKPLPDDGIYRLELAFGDRRLVFDCVITSAELGCEVGAVMQAAIGFTMTGTLIEALV